MKILLGRQAAKKRLQHIVLMLRFRIYLSFYFNHQMHLFAVFLNNFKKSGNQAAMHVQFGQRHLIDVDIRSKYSL